MFERNYNPFCGAVLKHDKSNCYGNPITLGLLLLGVPFLEWFGGIPKGKLVFFWGAPLF